MESLFKPSLLAVGLLLLGGCSSAPFKPAGLTHRDVTRKLNDLSYTCATLKMGTPVQVKFYQGDIDPKGTAPGGTLTGYLYGCNKMNYTISVAQKPLSWRDRGDAYYLQYVDEITPVEQAKADVPESHPVRNLLKVQHDDPQRQLLTQ
jgi:hypothetical protein